MPYYDYQSLPIDTQVEGGKIEKCTHCGKLGLKEQVNGMDFYTHAMGWRIQTNDLHESVLEMCPKPLPRPVRSV